jgi:hypothetical protein
MTVVVARSGRRLNLAGPRKDMVTVEDIAEHLAKQPMYLGGTWGFYSVAQHSVLVASEVARTEGPLAALYALLHHAGEAYARDPRTSFVRFLHGAFDLDWPQPKPFIQAIAHAHDCVELTERRQLMNNCGAEIAMLEARGAKSLRGMIKPIGWDRALKPYLDALRVNAVAAQLPKLPVWGALL